MGVCTHHLPEHKRQSSFVVIDHIDKEEDDGRGPSNPFCFPEAGEDSGRSVSPLGVEVSTRASQVSLISLEDSESASPLGSSITQGMSWEGERSRSPLGIEVESGSTMPDEVNIQGGDGLEVNFSHRPFGSNHIAPISSKPRHRRTNSGAV